MENTNPFESAIIETRDQGQDYPEMMATLKEDIKKHTAFKENFYRGIKSGDFIDAQDNYQKWRQA
jgi:hypothetical protein